MCGFVFNFLFVFFENQHTQKNDCIRLLHIVIPIGYSFGVFGAFLTLVSWLFRFTFFFSLLASIHMIFALQWGCALKPNFFILGLWLSVEINKKNSLKHIRIQRWLFSYSKFVTSRDKLSFMWFVGAIKFFTAKFNSMS